MSDIAIPSPELQIDFSFALGQIRTLYLQDALSATIDDMDMSLLDRQLSEYVPQEQLKALAKHGLRGELVFPVSCLFEVNPRLLGYYRLLLGFSQKEFYTTKFGLSGFKSMEVKGILTDKNAKRLKDLCKGLVSSAVSLVDGIGADRLSKQLLAVGPQLRGGANVKKGIAGIVSVFQSIHDIVEHAAINSTASKIELANAADRRVLSNSRLIPIL